MLYGSLSYFVIVFSNPRQSYFPPGSSLLLQDDDDGILADDDTYAPAWLDPPPSISTTPFPTFRDVPIPKLSKRATCQASLVPTIMPSARPSFTAFPTGAVARNVTFRVKKQVRLYIKFPSCMNTSLMQFFA